MKASAMMLLVALALLTPELCRGQLFKNDTSGVFMHGVPGMVKNGTKQASDTTSPPAPGADYRVVYDSSGTSSGIVAQWNVVNNKRYSIIFAYMWEAMDEIFPQINLEETDYETRSNSGYTIRIIDAAATGTSASGYECTLTGSTEWSVCVIEHDSAYNLTGWNFSEGSASSASLNITSQTGAVVLTAIAGFANTGETIFTKGTGQTVLYDNVASVFEYLRFIVTAKDGETTTTNSFTMDATTDYVYIGQSRR